MTTQKSNSDSRGTALATAPDSDLREQVRILGDDVKELARLSKSAVIEKVGAAKDAAHGAVELGREKASEYRDAVADRTREEPIKALLIAAGVGALVGIVLGRR